MIAWGSVPDNAFEHRLSVTSRDIEYSVVGSVLLMVFKDTSNDVIALSPEIASGRVPFSRLDARAIAVTGPLPVPHVTPYQPHGWAGVSQPTRAVHPKPLVAMNSSTSDDRSFRSQPKYGLVTPAMQLVLQVDEAVGNSACKAVGTEPVS